MQERIIISGYGGQGILSAGLLIAETSALLGYEVTYFPSYGAEMRGGSANCSIIFSDKKISSAVIPQADTLILFNQASFEKYIGKVQKNGLVIVNSSAITVPDEILTSGPAFVRVPVDNLAMESFGKTKVANMIMIGAYFKIKAYDKLDALKKSITEKFKTKGDALININFQAVDLGFAY